MEPPAQSALDRLQAELLAKAAWMVGMTVFICVPYFSLQQGPWATPWQPPVTALDRLVSFDPRWVLPYLSIVLLVPLFPMLATRRADVARYVVGVGLLCLPCFLCFALYPVAGPRPETSTPGLHEWLIGVDEAWNSMPSLHAGLATYSGLYGWWLLAPGWGPRPRAAFAAFLLLWVAIILFGTLATKQHWAVDLPPAMVLAGLAHLGAGRIFRASGGSPVPESS